MVSKSVQSLIDSLRDHPVALSLLALNCIFLAANAWSTHEIAQNSRVREASFHAIIKDCIEEKQR
jgi:hypothetical protein